LTANLLKERLGLPLSETEIELERALGRDEAHLKGAKIAA
jgi:hypothetical protein